MKDRVASSSSRDIAGRAAAGGSAAKSVVRPGAGLRLRLWVACLLGGFAGAGAVLGLFAWLSPADPLFNPATLGIWPWSAAAFCLVLAVTLGLWLDHGIASHLRGLSRAIASGDPTELGALPAAARWGELSLLTAQLQSLLVRQRELGRGLLELEELRHRIRSLRVAVEMRPRGQRTEPLRPLEGPLGPLVEVLNRHWADDDEVEVRCREEALGLRRELTLALTDARDSTEQAERGFVEATSLLTTVRELQRLNEISQTDTWALAVRTTLADRQVDSEGDELKGKIVHINKSLVGVSVGSAKKIYWLRTADGSRYPAVVGKEVTVELKDNKTIGKLGGIAVRPDLLQRVEPTEQNLAHDAKFKTTTIGKPKHSALFETKLKLLARKVPFWGGNNMTLTMID